MNIVERIQKYLIKCDCWVPSDRIYVKALSDYPPDSISAALETIAHTPPFAMQRVASSDYHTLEKMRVPTGGTYYIHHTMPPEHLAKVDESLKAFDELP